MQIRHALTIRFASLAGAILLLFSLGIYALSSIFLNKEFKKELKTKSELTARLLLKEGQVDTSLIYSFSKQTLNEMLGEEMFISMADGQPLYNTFTKSERLNFADDVKHLSDVKENYFTTNNQLHYGRMYEQAGKQVFIIITAKNFYADELNTLKLFLVVGMLLAIIIIVITGKFFATRALKPVEKVVEEVDSLSATNLHRRLDEGNGKDEIAHLASTFNKLLERMESSFILQRNFVANASHELRTPLSAITAQLEVTLMHNRNAEEYKIVMNSVLNDIKKMNQLSEALMDLTLADRDVTLMKFVQVRMDELLLQSRDELIRKHPDYKIHIHFGEFPDDEQALSMYGKEHLLKATIKNIIDNACKYSANKTADVHLSIAENSFEIRCIDTGIGIPAQHMKLIFTPLQRADNARKYPGHGLGLALVKKIVELHHGKITINSTQDAGTEVIIHLNKKAF